MKKYLAILLAFLLVYSCSSPNKSADETREVDVCVYGATSAGVMAAYTAKKMGKSVLIVDPSEHIGGLTTGGLGATDIGNKYAITGLARLF